MRRWLLPVVLLPGTVLVFVPGLILWCTRHTDFAYVMASPRAVRFWLGLLILAPGVLLAFGSVRLFFRFGEGTAAPWDPPQRLVVRGVYRHARNPMITGVVLILVGGAMLLGSWPVALWAGVFLLASFVYFPLSEEPALRRRFGAEYDAYARHVPRWIPRRTPWSPGDDQRE